MAGSLILPRAPAADLRTQAESFEEKCSKFRPDIADATFELSEHIAKDDQVELKYRDATCGGPGVSSKVQDEICRVALYVPTSHRSGIHFEAWLPRSWNNRFLSTGNGGIAGCMSSSRMIALRAHDLMACRSRLRRARLCYWSRLRSRSDEQWPQWHKWRAILPQPGRLA